MMKHRLTNIVLVTIGFILSPLTWWNDLVINVPLAYLFSAPFSLIDKQLFLPSFVIGYWLSNLLGLLMLHWGGEGLLRKKKATPNMKQSLLVSLVYSAIIIIMVFLGWLAPPSVYLEKYL